MTSGICCAGNDRVHNWLVTMLTSVRRHSGDVPITLIPFDDNLARTRRLCRRMDVEILPTVAFAELDAFSRTLLPDAPIGLMRRFSSFWGPYEHFIYLDADVVAVQSVRPLLGAVERYSPHVLYLDANLDEVYKPGPLRAKMVTEHNARGINAGVFGGTRGVLSLDVVQGFFDEYATVAGDTIPLADQTYLNYVLDRLGVACLAFTDVLDVSGGWAGHRYHTEDGALIASRLAPSQTRAAPVALLHWAGFALTPAMPHFRLWLSYRGGRGARALHAARIGAPLVYDRLTGRVRARLKPRARLARISALLARRTSAGE